MSRKLRDALGCFATGVTVVTSRYQGHDYGLTCSSFNSVSLEPALVLWSLQRNNRTRNAYLHSGGYTVSILADDQSAMAMQFAGGDPQQRFKGLKLQRSPAGRVLIPDCVAWFDCELKQTIPAGDHDILLGEVTDFEHIQGQGLIFERSRFGRLATAA